MVSLQMERIILFYEYFLNAPLLYVKNLTLSSNEISEFLFLRESIILDVADVYFTGRFSLCSLSRRRCHYVLIVLYLPILSGTVEVMLHASCMAHAITVKFKSRTKKNRLPFEWVDA